MVLNSNIEKILWDHLKINENTFVSNVNGDELFLSANINYDYVYLRGDDILYILKLKEKPIINAENIRFFCNIEDLSTKNLQKINTDAIAISFKDKNLEKFDKNRWAYKISNLNIRSNYLFFTDFNGGITMPDLNLVDCNIITDNLEIDDGMLVNIETNNKIITKNIFTSSDAIDLSSIIEKGKKFNQYQVSGINFVDEDQLQCIYVERYFSNGCGVVYKIGSYLDDLVNSKQIKINKKMKINDQWKFVDFDYFNQKFPEDCSSIENYKIYIKDKKDKFFKKRVWKHLNIFKNENAKIK